MWHQVRELKRGVRGAVPADHHPHDGGRRVGGILRWVPVAPLPDGQARALPAEAFPSPAKVHGFPRADRGEAEH